MINTPTFHGDLLVQGTLPPIFSCELKSEDLQQLYKLASGKDELLLLLFRAKWPVLKPFYMHTAECTQKILFVYLYILNFIYLTRSKPAVNSIGKDLERIKEKLN